MSWLENARRRGAEEQATVDAMVKASADRGALARLRRAGRALRRDGEYELRHPEAAKPFVASVEALASPHAGKNLAIRPNRKKARKRR